MAQFLVMVLDILKEMRRKKVILILISRQGRCYFKAMHLPDATQRSSQDMFSLSCRANLSYCIGLTCFWLMLLKSRKSVQMRLNGISIEDHLLWMSHKFLWHLTAIINHIYTALITNKIVEFQRRQIDDSSLPVNKLIRSWQLKWKTNHGSELIYLKSRHLPAQLYCRGQVEFDVSKHQHSLQWVSRC